MATTQHPAADTLPGIHDPIRVVPLHVDDSVVATAPGVPPGPAPSLTYRGGPLLTAVEVFTFFWGAAWQAQPQAGLAQQINQFFDYALSSALIDQMSEYNVPGKTIGHGKHTGSITLAVPALRHSVTDTGIQQFVQHEIATNAAVPKPTPNSLYFVYLPPGVVLSQGGGRSCMTFCGYHSDINNGKVYYAAMPYPGCAGCTGGLSALDALTSTSSHELCEAITDAIPGQGWYDDHNGEIGDICAWQTKKLGAYTVQLEWSNKAGKCI
jgi:hypothetical protein